MNFPIARASTCRNSAAAGETLRASSWPRELSGNEFQRQPRGQWKQWRWFGTLLASECFRVVGNSYQDCGPPPGQVWGRSAPRAMDFRSRKRSPHPELRPGGHRRFVRRGRQRSGVGTAWSHRRTRRTSGSRFDWRLQGVLHLLRFLCRRYLPGHQKADHHGRPPLGSAQCFLGSEQQRHGVSAEPGQPPGIVLESGHGTNPATYGKCGSGWQSGVAFAERRQSALEVVFAAPWVSLSPHR